MSGLQPDTVLPAASCLCSCPRKIFFMSSLQSNTLAVECLGFNATDRHKQGRREEEEERERESVCMCVCVCAEGVLQIFCRVERGMMSHCHMTSFRVFLCS